MRKLCSLLAVVLCVWHHGSAQGDGCYSMANGCCSLCHPGYFLQHKCGPCLRCPDRGYTDGPNSRSSCRMCRRCEGIFQYKSNCSATRNAVCGCRAGKKCADEACSQCENNPCPAGQQLSGEKCESCPSGTFNPGTEGTCKPWKNCPAIDAILVNGTSTSDVVCVNKLAKPTRMSATSAATSRTKVVTTIGVDIVTPVIACTVFFIILSAVVIVCILLKLEKIKDAFKPIKQTKDEDGCSCHFPEEEDGGGSGDAGRDDDARTATLLAV